jgi:hypothetical protein
VITNVAQFPKITKELTRRDSVQNSPDERCISGGSETDAAGTTTADGIGGCSTSG